MKTSSKKLIYKLTKSKYVRGLQCVKALYYDVYHPTWARYDKETLKKFCYGREFESIVKARFEGGIDVSSLCKDFADHPATTQQLLQTHREIAIYEAGFFYNDVLVLADIVRKNDDGSIDVYEVKSSNHMSSVYMQDAAIQYYVISNCVETINTFNVVHAVSGGGLMIVDLLKYCQSCYDDIHQHVELFKDVLCQQEPYVDMGSHCDSPYACPYKRHCQGKDSLLGFLSMKE